MLNPPQTKAEAAAYRYDRWAGNPGGYPFKEGQCAYTVWPAGRGIHCYQCCNKPGKGPDGLYCGIHAKKATPSVA